MHMLVINKSEIHASVNFVVLQGFELKKYLQFGNRSALAKDLKVSILNYLLFMIY